MSLQNMTRKQIITVYQRAATLTDSGSTPAEVQQRLGQDGLDEQDAAEVLTNLPTFRATILGEQTSENGAAGMLLWCLGLVVFAAGMGFFIGNVTDAFRTFPFAGYLTMALGGSLIGSAMRSSSILGR